MAGGQLVFRGGAGPPIVLVHGLMGRGSTWSQQWPWLARLGAVHTFDAPWHRGRDVVDPYPVSTERFTDALAAAVAPLGRPAVLVGHSMGALHAWCVAALRPELVAALVVEDMAPDFRGRTTGAWEPWVRALPEEFGTAGAVLDAFGPVAGRYFLAAFDRTATGWRLHGRVERWVDIAAEWGRRDFWPQWWAVRAPTLLIEAGDSVTPADQMRTMATRGGHTRHLLLPGGHLLHDDAPAAYRAAVTEFLASLRVEP